MIFDCEFKEVIKDYKIKHNWQTIKISFAGYIISILVLEYLYL